MTLVRVTGLSSKWFDPNVARLSEQREEERLAERLLDRAGPREQGSTRPLAPAAPPHRFQ